MNARHAMTLIETLVVVAIIGILLGLVLPGIQKVREGANRVQCANQLRQIALACHGYHNVSGAFPPGYVACDSTDPLETNPGWGWASHLLPFLDQNAAFQDIVFHEPIQAPANQARMSARYGRATTPVREFVFRARCALATRCGSKCQDLAATALCNSRLQIIHFRENRF